MTSERAHSVANRTLVNAGWPTQPLSRGANRTAARPIACREPPFGHRAWRAGATAAALIVIGYARIAALVRPLHTDEGHRRLDWAALVVHAASVNPGLQRFHLLRGDSTAARIRHCHLDVAIIEPARGAKEDHDRPGAADQWAKA